MTTQKDKDELPWGKAQQGPSGSLSIYEDHPCQALEDDYISGRFIEESQAKALYEGSRMILEMWNEPGSLLASPEYDEAIALLRKGVGNE